MICNFFDISICNTSIDRVSLLIVVVVCNIFKLVSHAYTVDGVTCELYMGIILRHCPIVMLHWPPNDGLYAHLILRHGCVHAHLMTRRQWLIDLNGLVALTHLGWWSRGSQKPCIWNIGHLMTFTFTHNFWIYLEIWKADTYKKPVNFLSMYTKFT